MHICRMAQRGFALISVLIMLMIITLFSLTAVRMSTTELHMARNQESTTIAFNGAQALTDAIIDAPSSFIVTGEVGAMICTSDCDNPTIIIQNEILTPLVGASILTGRVTRLAPALRPPPRAIGSSADKFMAAGFEVAGLYDNTDENQGRVAVAEGVTVLIPTN